MDLQKTKRDLLPDMIKGFAIFLVVFGHCIQNLNGGDYLNLSLFFDNIFYRFIYTFHMPLFALVAGFYAYKSIARIDQIQDKKEKAKKLFKRASTLLIPVFVWNTVSVIIFLITSINYSWNMLGEHPEFITGMIKGAFLRLVTDNWFLISMLINFLLVYIMHKLFKDNIIPYIIIFILALFLPDGMNMQVYKFMLFYYVVAFYYSKSVATRDKSRTTKKNIILLAISIIIFIPLFIFYNKNTFIYLTGIRINRGGVSEAISQLLVDLHRFAIGFAGSVMWILVLYFIKKIFSKYSFPVLSHLGQLSMGIYIISGIILGSILPAFTQNNNYNIFRTILFACLVTAVSAGITFGISKIKYISKIVGK